MKKEIGNFIIEHPIISFILAEDVLSIVGKTITTIGEIATKGKVDTDIPTIVSEQ